MVDAPKKVFLALVLLRIIFYTSKNSKNIFRTVFTWAKSYFGIGDGEKNFHGIHEEFPIG
jgi:hypothetical protein